MCKHPFKNLIVYINARKGYGLLPYRAIYLKKYSMVEVESKLKRQNVSKIELEKKRGTIFANKQKIIRQLMKDLQIVCV